MKCILSYFFLLLSSIHIALPGNAQFSNHGALVDSLKMRGINAVMQAPFKTGFIRADLGRQMSKNYKNDRGKAFVRGSNTRDARSIWFSLDKLKYFIRQIEAATPYKGKRLDLGVRMYYILYPDSLTNPGLRGLSANVARKHSIMMVPTYYDATHNMNIDFSFAHLGDSSMPMPFYQVLDRFAADTSVFAVSQSYTYTLIRTIRAGAAAGNDTSASIENHGGLSPPPENGGSFPTPSGAGQLNKLPTARLSGRAAGNSAVHH